MKLKPLHYECIRLMLDTQQTQRAIAEMLGVAEETVYRWGKDETFKTELHKQTQAKFQAMSVKAVKELERLISGADSDAVKLNAIKDVLDRGGYKPTDKKEVELSGVEIVIDYGE